MVWDDLGRDAKHETDKERDRFIGVYIGILAVLLALCTLGGGNATKDATIKNIEASNTWAFFQAKNMRRHVLRLETDALELRRATEAGLSAEAKTAITARIADYRKQDAALTSDPDKPEGKREGLDQLWQKARALETERDIAMRRDPYFDYGQALLQIAIVLASVAIVAGGTAVLWASGALALAGLLMTFNGFTLAIPLPWIG